MKIYNYSDKPVVIGGIPTHEHVIYINNSMQRHMVIHNDKQFLSTNVRTADRNIIYSINNHPNGSYDYREQNLKTPDIWVWVSVFLTFFSFYFVIRIVQKLKVS